MVTRVVRTPQTPRPEPKDRRMPALVFLSCFNFSIYLCIVTKTSGRFPFFLLRCNSHSIKYHPFKSTVRWFLLYSQGRQLLAFFFFK